MNGPTRQINHTGPARYALVDRQVGEADLCRSCGGDIVHIDGRWHAVEGRWPNLAHCHYSARDGSSVGHTPAASSRDRPA